MPDLFDEIRTQRAHRALRPDAVSEDLVEHLLDAAIHAPSAENRQPWAFVVVRDPAQRRRISESVRDVWERHARERTRQALSSRFFDAVDRWATTGLAEAPLLIVVCGDTSAADPHSLAASIYPATQNLLLAAQGLGLGALLSTLPTASPDLATILELPAHVRPMAVVPIGWPVRPLGPPRRAPFREKTHRDRWGAPW
jgi:nitroreductase